MIIVCSYPLVTRAQTNPEPDAVIAFGLRHSVLGNAVLGQSHTSPPVSSPPGGPLTISGLGSNGLDGVSVHLGEADSGVFIAPHADIWGFYDENWLMVGRAYGRVGRDTNALLCTVRGRKPYYETYPVAVDFSPLNPSRLTFQVYSNRQLIASGVSAGSTGLVTVYTAPYLAPQVNPLWRWADGSVGTLIEFTRMPGPGDDITGEYTGDFRVEGPFGAARGDRVFIRADGLERRVSSVARVEVVGGGGFQEFAFLDERLGMFGHPHRALGECLLTALRGRLRISALSDPDEFPVGARVDLDDARRFDTVLLPLELSAEQAAFQIYSDALQAELKRRNGVLTLGVDFTGSFRRGTEETSVPYQAPLEVRVYRHGIRTGSVSVSNNAVLGTLSDRRPGRVPALAGCAIVAEESAGTFPVLVLTFSRPFTFTSPDEMEFRGDQLRIAPGARVPSPVALSSVSFTLVNQSSFTLIREQSRLVPPVLRIEAAGETVALSWPLLNEPFVLESAEWPQGPFTTAGATVEIAEGESVTTLPSRTTAKFFRLRRTSD